MKFLEGRRDIMLKCKNNYYYFKYSDLPLEKQQICYCEIKNFVKRVSWEYRGFWNWYDKLFSSKFQLEKKREIIICQSDVQIVGIAILKKDIDEQKICTLRVAKEFQHRGIGKELMALSLEWLQNDKPLITVHKCKSHEFSALFNYYGFILEEKQVNYYHLFNTELVYNGSLPAKEFLLNAEEILDLENMVKWFVKSGKQNFNEFLDICIQQWWVKEQLRKQIIKG